MIYKLILGPRPEQAYVIGQSIGPKEFQVYTYAELGMNTLQDWETLFKLYLHEEVVQFRKENDKIIGPDPSIGGMFREYDYSEIMALMQSGWRISHKPEYFTLTRGLEGKIVDEFEQSIMMDAMMTMIHRGYSLVAKQRQQ